MERESFKEYSEAAIVEKKDEIMLLKSFIHLYHWGRYFCRTEQAERKRIFKQLRDFTVKEITFFDRNLC